jgi:hypothetical protein
MDFTKIWNISSKISKYFKLIEIYQHVKEYESSIGVDLTIFGILNERTFTLHFIR